MGDDSYIASIGLFAGQKWHLPRGWFYCDGRTLNVRDYPALYSLIGNYYGGSPGTTFNLPNMNQGKREEEPHYAICYQGMYPQGE